MKTALQAAAKIFGRNNFKANEPPGFIFETKYKVVVFVPILNADELTFAMASNGAGIIGNYSVCSFRSNGFGTFLGGKNSKPAIGKKGRFGVVEEVKLEMLCPAVNLARVTRSIYKVHPYEEPAIEVYEVMIPVSISSKDIAVFPLKRSVPLKSIISRLNSALDLSVFPAVYGKLKIKNAVFDLSENPELSYRGFEKNTLLIRKIRNTLTIEIL